MNNKILYITNPKLSFTWLENKKRQWLISSINMNSNLTKDTLSVFFISILFECTKPLDKNTILNNFMNLKISRDECEAILEELLKYNILIEKDSKTELSSWIRNYTLSYSDYSKDDVSSQDKQKMIKYNNECNYPEITKLYTGEKYKLKHPSMYKLPKMKKIQDIMNCNSILNSTVISKDLLSGFLFYLFGSQRVGTFHDFMPVLCKSYPSNGARHILDLYICLKDLSWIDDGMYYYNPIEHTLILISDQSIKEKGITLIVTVNYERMQWRYRHSWVYRDVLFELGHFYQHLKLICFGYGISFTEESDDFPDDILSLQDLKEEIAMVVGLGR